VKRAAFLVNVQHVICVVKFNTLIHTSVMLHLYFQGFSLVFLSRYGKVTLYVLYKFLLLTSFFYPTLLFLVDKLRCIPPVVYSILRKFSIIFLRNKMFIRPAIHKIFYYSKNYILTEIVTSKLEKNV
jgi:hypothetical protein